MTTVVFNAGGIFTPPAGVTSVDVLIVDGGGSGAVGNGNNGNGAGGGGRVKRVNGVAVTPGVGVTVTVGAGGALKPAGTIAEGADGGLSSFGATTTGATTGGGGGGRFPASNSAPNGQGRPGGSGGGAGSSSSSGYNALGGAADPSSVAGEGHAGGNGNGSTTISGRRGGGGGGAGAAGTSGVGGAGNGGAGVDHSAWLGTGVGESGWFGGGGGGSTQSGIGGATPGGIGGGGDSGTTSVAAQAGMANTGGGGGAGHLSAASGAGGSGVVIVVYSVAAPNVPSSVVGSATADTGTITWAAPVGGGPVDHYEVRIDGGTPVNPATSPHVFTGLTPGGVSYDLEVRAVGAGGSSSWVLVTVETDIPTPPGYYRVELSLGAHTWDVSSEDTLELVADYPHVRLPLTLGWDLTDSVEFFPAQPNLTTMGFAVQCNDASDLADVVKGSPVRFRMFVDNDPDAEPWQTFDGVVTQLDGETVVSPADPEKRDLIVTVFAGDDNIRLADAFVGYTADWPVEHIAERFERICTEAGVATDDLGVAHGLGQVGWLRSRTQGAPVNALEALKQTLKDAADDYDSEPPDHFYGRYVFQYQRVEPDDDTEWVVGVWVARRRVFDTTTLDGGFVRAAGQWVKEPGPTAATWVIVDTTVFGTPDATAPYVRSTSLFDTTAEPDPINYSATERDNLGESLLTDGSTALDGWASRALVYEAARSEDLAPVALWASPQFNRGYVVTPVVVTPIGPELELNDVDYVAGTLTGARLTIPPSGQYVIEFRLRAELLPGTVTP